MIHTRNLLKQFKTTVAVDQISLTLDEGELVIILGPSGCGKTTLLRLIAGLEQPDAGVIEINNRAVFSEHSLIPPHQRGLSMIFQDLALWPHMRVIDNLLFGLKAAEAGHKKKRERALEVLRWVGLDEYALRHPHQISGGERQRLAIARAVAPGNPYLLMDEPFSNLDPLLKLEMIDLVRRLRKEIGITVLYVTHSLDEALALGDRILMMSSGRLVGELGPDELENLTQERLLSWYREKLQA
ncbi:MAG: ABC transporter ATP-binding protein [Gammaproteobacteria bacterium]|nr:ABC transporter ATP-binding protein [Gammaproteobacteria bacterium]